MSSGDYNMEEDSESIQGAQNEMSQLKHALDSGQSSMKLDDLIEKLLNTSVNTK